MKSEERLQVFSDKPHRFCVQIGGMGPPVGEQNTINMTCSLPLSRKSQAPEGDCTVDN